MSLQPAYHDSVGVHRVERGERERKANLQEQACLRWFRAHPDAAFSPEEVWQAVLPHAPLTSVRRALTNLTARAALEKLDRTTMGSYGHRTHVWGLARPSPVVQERLF